MSSHSFPGFFTMFKIDLNKLLETNKLGLILRLLFAYIAICGLAMFPAFIFQEAIQVAIWGTWPAKKANNWGLVLTGCDLIKNINRGLKIINYSAGWVQPLAFFSYRSFSKATDYYIMGLEHQILAHAPEEFVGRTIEFEFVPLKIIQDKDGIKLMHNRIQIVVDKMPVDGRIVVKGRVEMVEGRIFINAKLKE